MTVILPLAQNAKLVTPDATFTPQFKNYLDSILERSGGVQGGQYSQLANTSGSILWDLNADPAAVVVLQSGVNLLAPPLNIVPGLMYRLTIVQPETGANGTISFPKPPFLFPGGVVPTLSTGNGALDELVFDSDGTNLKLIIEGLNYS